jgi:hypothetical protein
VDVKKSPSNNSYSLVHKMKGSLNKDAVVGACKRFQSRIDSVIMKADSNFIG